MIGSPDSMSSAGTDRYHRRVMIQHESDVDREHIAVKCFFRINTYRRALTIAGLVQVAAR